MGALFLFAHQDDEYAAAPWIVREVAAGASIACVYLTDGGSRVDPAVRDAESRRALHALGVGDDAVVFLAVGATRVADGALASRAVEASAALEVWLGNAFVPERIYAPSYEGGHPDHDAAHVIAACIASRYGALERCRHFALYNGYRCPAPFFSSLRQLPSTAPRIYAALPMRKRWTLSWLCCTYASQRKTWLGLFPGAFVERMLGREHLVPADAARLRQRPHPGELLYERLFATRYDDVAAALKPLVDRL
ncbi:MAG: PIG-L family deacetylase [Candidatus Eremiobacteraeota bacterium]|nr:PIG-L family deacetylase [Candidatus Eremiobacteraeota bacterium]